MNRHAAADEGAAGATRPGVPRARRHGGVSARTSRTTPIAALLALVVAASALTVLADDAGRQCAGSGCLPGGGYTWDSGVWNCGLIYSNQACFQPGNCLGLSCARVHTFGWGSADYDGSGKPTVVVTAICIESFCTEADGFSAAGIKLARACRFNDCDDQDYGGFKMGVQHAAGGTTRHTILGHGKA